MPCRMRETQALIRRAIGSSFARLPVVLNIVQLIGWTTFELVVMRDGALAIARQAGVLAPAASLQDGVLDVELS